MQRIKSIHLENFKFFYGYGTELCNTIQLDGDNLLLYGENGSGKSSIYWALYTFLQSTLKEDPQIDKYFNARHDENLRNRFAEESAKSGIKIMFENQQQAELSREISSSNINTKSDSFIKQTLDSSDFINYRYLSKLYDFSNSEPINLFPLFEGEILMFIDFGEPYTDHSGNSSGKTNAADWWKFIVDAPKQLPYNGNVVSVGSEAYKRFKDVTLPRFVELLKKFLLEITQSANDYLQTEFKEGYSISFNTDTIECDYNKYVSQRAKDGILYPPKIPLQVKYNHSKLEEHRKNVLKPHTFLNEARLTAIALAIRFAILDQRPKFPNSARLLILDDLLLSLDMSHRNIVLDIILKKVTDFQLLILTHDKMFFELAKHKAEKNKSQQWKFFELYSHEKDGIPQPLKYESDSYLGNAKKYLKEKKYEIAGNFLRKEAESFCKKFLPDRLKLGEFGGLKPLAQLLQQLVEFFNQNGLDSSIATNLDSYRKFLLNDSSHDSYDVPKFRSEIENCINTLEQLNKIQFTSSVKWGQKLVFELQSDANTSPEKAGLYKFVIRIADDFRLIKEVGKESILTKGKINYKVYKDGTLLPSKVQGDNWNHDNISLKNLYDNLYTKSDKTKSADFWEEVIVSKTGQKLRELRMF